MDTSRLGPDFTVIVDDHGSWCDWFPSRTQAISYARLVFSLSMGPVSVLDCDGAVVAEFSAHDSPPPRDLSNASCNDPTGAGMEAPLASTVP